MSELISKEGSFAKRKSFLTSKKEYGAEIYKSLEMIEANVFFKGPYTCMLIIKCVDAFKI